MTIRNRTLKIDDSPHSIIKLSAWGLCICMICLNSTVAIAQVTNEKPNIIFILADDMGYGDVAALNSKGKIRTPNLDKMSQSGMVFTDAHGSSAVCTPSRYGILTGRYNWRSSLKNGVLGIYDQPIISPERTTIPSMLAKQGYNTACIGKWHLGFNWVTTDGKKPIDDFKTNNINYKANITGGPRSVGFNYFFGVDAPNYPPYAFIENEQLTAQPDTFYAVNPELDCRGGSGVKNWSLENVFPFFQQKAIDYINKMGKNKSPFFLYLPITAPHTPIVPDKDFSGKSGLNKYADFVMQVDAYVGEIINVLQKNNLLNNTLIVFTSDNGASPQANFKELEEKNHNPNYIFRGMKSDIYEGGHHIPCLVQWPKVIKGNQPCNQTISLNDFMATFAKIAGYQLADSEGEDSYNLLPLFENPASKTIIREAIVYHSINGSFSIRKGKWKLEMTAGSGGWSFPKPGKQEDDLPVIQLYNMENDIGETKNVEAENPLIVKEMTALLKQYVENGRSTKGKPQKNDGLFLKNRMKWMEN